MLPNNVCFIFLSFYLTDPWVTKAPFFESSRLFDCLSLQDRFSPTAQIQKDVLLFKKKTKKNPEVR